MTRSKYLDDLNVLPGQYVICKADIIGQDFTPGKKYAVQPDGMLINDKGEQVTPSARFVIPTSSGVPLSEWGPWRQSSTHRM